MWRRGAIRVQALPCDSRTHKAPLRFRLGPASAGTIIAGMDVSDDGLLDNRVRLLQPARGYRVAIDAVLLAAAVPARAGERVIDIGCGAGAAALCLMARLAAAGVTDVRVIGLEVQPRLAALARRNAGRNGFAERMEIVAGDVAAPPQVLGTFDHVMTNPPYLPAARADLPPDRSKALATVESTADLAVWMAFCLQVLRPGGTLSLVHRADRQAEIVDLLRPHAADIAILPLLPQEGVVARRLLLRLRQGRDGKVRILPGMVLHRAGGEYTPAAEAVLRGAQPLEIG
jgi:tRNA1(Val) A37 N6-methylase TrmN6